MISLKQGIWLLIGEAEVSSHHVCMNWYTIIGWNLECVVRCRPLSFSQSFPAPRIATSFLRQSMTPN